MFSLFKSKKASRLVAAPEPTEPSLKAVVGSVPSYSDWRKDKDRVAIAVRVLATPEHREMLQVLRADPTHKSLHTPLASSEAAAAAYWLRRGYDLALDSLEKLGEPAPAAKQEPTPTFEPED